MTTDELRRSYIDFFKTREHKEIKSSSLIPDDPTLLFTSAGMVQFKDKFLGIGVESYSRAVSCQKCLRTGDVENVGRTPRHLTFFEMLGNFSFGDYFKEEAIVWGWEYVSESLKLSKNDVWVSVHTDDKEAYGIWKDKVGFPEKRIVALDDNWWGPVDPQGGVCGPDSEMYLDMGGGCGKEDCSPGCDCDRFIEFWNLVFQQYDQDKNGKRKPLEKPGVDTGMGLERTAAILQNKKSVFEIDEFSKFIDAIKRSISDSFISEIDDSGMKIGARTSTLPGELSNKEKETSIRIIADHLRAACFLLSEGVTPGNEKREYVLRSLIRRAVRHGNRLGFGGPFLHTLVNANEMIWGKVYSDLKRNVERTIRVLKGEEEQFRTILNNGIDRLQELISDTKKKKKMAIDGTEIFRLYDTYGFPNEIAEEIIEEAGLQFDKNGFEKAMQSQREQARSNWRGSGDEYVDRHILTSLDGIKPTIFVGYDRNTVKAKLIRTLEIKQEDGAAHVVVDNVEESAVTTQVENKIYLILDKTPFYSESGGQKGDIGVIVGEGFEFGVKDTQLLAGGIIGHIGCFSKGDSSKVTSNEDVAASIDEKFRRRIAVNHTATHLLHQALQEVLGEHVEQAGSLVESKRLRFDFTHHKPLEIREIDIVEARVNEMVRQNLPVETEETDLKKAQKDGAKAFFQDKYGEKVRVVNIGSLSKELCGGTHVETSGAIGFFKIFSQSSVAAGIRRIEAVTGARAVETNQEMERKIAEIAELLNVGKEGLTDRIKQLNKKIKGLEKGEKQKRTLDLVEKCDELIKTSVEVEGGKLILGKLQDALPEEMRQLGDRIKDKLKDGVIVLASAHEGKGYIIIMVTGKLPQKYPAGKLMKVATGAMDGKGGGRPESAQGGGDPAKIEDAFEALKRELQGREK